LNPGKYSVSGSIRENIPYPELYTGAASVIKEVGDMNKIEQSAAFWMNERRRKKVRNNGYDKMSPL
jgi:hypothetical protein